jgi:hypothetical protein
LHYLKKSGVILFQEGGFLEETRTGIRQRAKKTKEKKKVRKEVTFGACFWELETTVLGRFIERAGGEGKGLLLIGFGDAFGEETGEGETGEGVTGSGVFGDEDLE